MVGQATLQKLRDVVETATPDRVVTKSVKRMRSIAQAAAHTYSSHMTQTASFQRTSTHTVSAAQLPELGGKGSHVDGWFKTYMGKLYRLLSMARDSKQECGKITKTDVAFLLGFCQNKRWAFFSDAADRLKKSIRIFSYIAGHGYSIPPAVINAVLERANQGGDIKVIKYAALTLSHIVHNRQALKPKLQDLVRACLERQLNILKREDLRENLQIIVSVISALAKMGRKPEEDELAILRSAITDIAPEDALLLYSASLSTLSMKPDNKSLTAWTDDGFLHNVKHNMKQSMHLVSEKELKKTIKLWGANASFNTKILRIIRYAVNNGQWSIVDNPKVSQIICDALSNPERKIRQDAIIILNILRKNGKLSKDMDARLSESLLQQRQYALEAVIAYLEANLTESHQRELTPVDAWSNALKNLEQHAKLRHPARYSLFLIKRKIDYLKELLLDPEFCVEASMALLCEAKRAGVSVDSDILLRLAKLATTKKFQLEARVNALHALGYLAEKKQIFSRNTIDLIAKLFSENSQEVLNAFIVLLGCCTDDNLSYLFSSDTHCGKHLFEWVAIFLDKPALLHNASILFANLVEKMQVLVAPEQLKHLVRVVGKKISDVSIAEEIRQSLCAGLYRVVNRYPECFGEDSIILNLTSILKSKADVETKRHALSILGLLVQGEADVSLSPLTISALIELFEDENQLLIDDVVYLLVDYLKKRPHALSEAHLDGLCNLLVIDRLRLLSSHVLLVAAETQCAFSQEQLKKLASLLHDDSPSDLRISVSKALQCLAAKQLPVEALIVLQNRLLDTEQEVVENSVMALKLAADSEKKAAVFSSPIFDKLIHHLSLVVLDVAVAEAARIDALILLERLGAINRKVDLEELEKISKMSVSEDVAVKLAILKFIDAQLALHQLSIANRNEAIISVIDEVTQQLSDAELLDQCLNVLAQAAQFGHFFSEDLLKKLIGVAVSEVVATRRNKALFILSHLKERGVLSSELVGLLKFENSIDQLRLHPLSEKQHSIILLDIELMVESGQPLTENAFEVFKELLFDGRIDLERLSAIFITAFSAGQSISAEVVAAFCTAMIKKFRQANGVFSISNTLLSLLRTFLDKGEYLSVEVYSICEALLMVPGYGISSYAQGVLGFAYQRTYSKDIEVRLSCLLDILTVASKRSVAISDLAINQLFTLLFSVKEEKNQYAIADLLSQVMVRQAGVKLPIDRLMAFLKQTKNTEIRQKIVLMIDCLTLKEAAVSTAEQVAILVDTLALVDDLEVVAPLVERLSKLHVKHQFSEDQNKIYLTRCSELVLHDESQSPGNKLEALSVLAEFSCLLSPTSFSDLLNLFEFLEKDLLLGHTDSLINFMSLLASVTFSSKVKQHSKDGLEVFFNKLVSIANDCDDSVLCTAIQQVLKKHLSNLESTNPLFAKLREQLNKPATASVLFRQALLSAVFVDSTTEHDKTVGILLSEKHRLTAQDAEQVFKQLGNYFSKHPGVIDLSVEEVDLLSYLLNNFAKFSPLLCRNILFLATRKTTPISYQAYYFQFFMGLLKATEENECYQVVGDYLLSVFLAAQDEGSQLLVLDDLLMLVLSMQSFAKNFVGQLVKILAATSSDEIRSSVATILLHIQLSTPKVVDTSVVKRVYSEQFQKTSADVSTMLFYLSAGVAQLSFVDDLACSELLYLSLLAQLDSAEAFSDEDRQAFDDLLTNVDGASLPCLLHALLIKQSSEQFSMFEAYDFVYMCLDMQTSSEVCYKLLANSYAELKSQWLQQQILHHDGADLIAKQHVINIAEQCIAYRWSVDLFIGIFSLSKKSSSAVELLDFFKFIDEQKTDEDVLFEAIYGRPAKNLHDLRANINLYKLLGQITAIANAFFNKTFRLEGQRHLEFYKLERLKDLSASLVKFGWSAEKLLKELTKFFEVKKDTFAFDDLLLKLQDSVIYRVSEEDFSRGLLNPSHVFRKLIIAKYFQASGKEKGLDELLAEISNPDSPNVKNAHLMDLLKTKKITDFFGKIQQQKKTKRALSSAYSVGEAIERWSESEIHAWAQHIKGKINSDNLPEVFAVISQACLLHFKYPPRQVQLLAAFVLLNPQQNMGRFAQIATGEGKSLIIAMLATIKALNGESVDVITSSPVLAKHDADKYQRFYRYFGLKAASNEDHSYSSGLKPCYGGNINIVYGDANNFEFDLLRTEYSDLGTRGKRPYQSVIVDEVDNLLIDENKKIAMLSDVKPGMRELTPVFVALWRQLQIIVSLEDLARKKAGEKLLDYKNYHEFSLKLHQDLKTFLNSIISESQMADGKKIVIPQHLKEFVETQSDNWIKSAIQARFVYRAGRQYKIKRNKQAKEVIIPIDYANTGVLQAGTVWSDGLHQFLQIKHGLNVSSESLTTNYLSNVALLSRYGSNITGMTGTLGSVHSREMLADVYPIDFVDVPTYREKKLQAYPDLLLNSSEAWLDVIVNNAVHEYHSGRVVLVVCETINKAEAIYKAILSKANKAKKVYLYTENDAQQDDFLSEDVKAGSIVVATNLAGRGTDIGLTAEAVKRGGLHVCCTFLPENQRVEDQVFGRAARKGQPGSANLMLDKTEIFGGLLLNSDVDTISEVRKIRDAREASHLSYIKQKEFPRINYKDTLFAAYLKLLEELKEVDAGEQIYEECLLRWGVEDSSIAKAYLKQVSIQSKRSALEESWGVWLKGLDVESILRQYPPEKLTDKFVTGLAKDKFLEFKNLVFERYQNNKIIHNASYYTSQGNAFLELAKSFGNVFYRKPLYELALHSFTEAIELDQNAYLAYYGKSYALLKLKPEDQEAKIEAKNCLRRCADIIDTIPFAQTQSAVTAATDLRDFSADELSEELSQQFTNSLEVLSLLRQSISLGIREIERSERLMDVDVVYGVGGVTEYHPRLDIAEAVAALKGAGATYAVTLRDLSIDHDFGDSLCDNSFHSLASYDVLAKFLQKNKVKAAPIVTVSFSSDRLKIGPEGLKAALKKLLPINFKKDLPSSAEAKTSKAEAADNPQLTVWDNVSAAGSAIGHGVSKLWSGIKKAGAVIATPATKLADFCERQYHNCKKAERLPVSVMLEVLPLDAAIGVFAEPVACDAFNLTIHHLSAPLLSSLKTRLQGLGVVFSILKPSDPNPNKSQFFIKTEIDHFEEETVANLDVARCSKDHALLVLQEIQRLNEAQKKADDEKAISQRCLISVNLEYVAIKQTEAEKLFDKFADKTKLSLKYEDLDRKNLSPLVYVTGDQHENAAFIFKKLDPKSAEHLLKNAKRPRRAMTVNAKPIEGEFSKLGLSRHEIAEFKACGYFQLYDVKEKAPMPWKSVALLSVLSLLQIAGGVALMTCTVGFGASMGIGLVAEGLADIVRIASVLYTREFDFSSYLAQKAISMAISLAFAGWSALKSSVAAAEGVATLADEAGVVSLAALKEALKRFGILTAEKVATETVTRTCTAIGNAVADSVREPLQHYAQDELRKQFAVWRSPLNRAFAIDKFRGDHKYQELLFQKAREIIVGKLAKGFRLPDLGIVDFSGLDVFFQEFRGELAEMEKELLKFEVHFERWVEKSPHVIKFSETDIGNICDKLRKMNVLVDGKVVLNKNKLASAYRYYDDPTANIVWQYDVEYYDLSQISFGDYDHCKHIIVQACLDFHRALSDEYCTARNTLMKKVAAEFSEMFQGATRAATNVMSSAAAMGANHGVGRGFRRWQADRELRAQAARQADGGMPPPPRTEPIHPAGDAAGDAAADAAAAAAQSSGVLGQAAGILDDVAGAVPPAGMPAQPQVMPNQAPIGDGAMPPAPHQELPRQPEVIPSQAPTGDAVIPPARDQAVLGSGGSRLDERLRNGGVFVSDGRVRGSGGVGGRDPRRVFEHLQRSNGVVAPGEQVRVSGGGGGRRHLEEQFRRRGGGHSSDPLEKLKGSQNQRVSAESRSHRPDMLRRRQGTNFRGISAPRSLHMGGRKAAILISVTTTQNIFWERYNQQSKREEKLKMLMLFAKYNRVKEEQLALLDVIGKEKIKIIKSLLGVIVSELYAKTLEKDKEVTRYSTEDIKQRTDEVWLCCFEHLHVAYDAMLIELKATDADFGEVGDLLKEAFNDYVKLNKERRMLTDAAAEVVKKVDLNDLGGKFLKLAESSQYSEAGQLLRDGKLGPQGFMAYTFFNGLFEAEKLTTQANFQVRLAVVELGRKALEMQMKLAADMVAIEQGRQALADMVTKRQSELGNSTVVLVKQCGDLVVSALKEKDPTLRGIILEQVAEQRALVDKQIAANEKISNDMAQVMKANGIDPSFLVEFAKAGQAMIHDIMVTVQQVSKDQQTTFDKLATTACEAFKQLIKKDDKKPAAADDGEPSLASVEGSARAHAALTASPSSTAGESAPTDTTTPVAALTN